MTNDEDDDDGLEFKSEDVCLGLGGEERHPEGVSGSDLQPRMKTEVSVWVNRI